MFYKTINLKMDERALVCADGHLKKILSPGKHRIKLGFQSEKVEVISIKNLEFQHELTEHLLANPSTELANFFVSVRLNAYQVGVRYANGTLVEVLPPNTRKMYWKGLIETKIEFFDIAQTSDVPKAIMPNLEHFLVTAPTDVLEQFSSIRLTENQVGLRSESGVLVEILPPASRKLYWKGVLNNQIEILEVNETLELSNQLVDRLTPAGHRTQKIDGLDGVLQIHVPVYMSGVLTASGQDLRLLPSGTYAFWKYHHNVAVELFDLRLQAVEVTGQEILTKDKVGLRINLSATWQFIDLLKAYAAMQKPMEHLYRELQFGLRSAVGTRTLDELLENKNIIDEVVMQHVTHKMAELGIKVQSVGVKDIVLPGEMKNILAKVVEAGKTAEANVIRRREETAATRSLLNTAKVMEDNPIALRMKELETLERVAERIDKISVFGGLESVLNGLIKLR